MLGALPPRNTGILPVCRVHAKHEQPARFRFDRRGQRRGLPERAAAVLQTAECWARERRGAGQWWRGCPCPESRRVTTSEARMAKRGRHRVSGCQEGIRERPANGAWAAPSGDRRATYAGTMPVPCLPVPHVCHACPAFPAMSCVSCGAAFGRDADADPETPPRAGRTTGPKKLLAKPGQLRYYTEVQYSFPRQLARFMVAKQPPRRRAGNRGRQQP